MENPVTTDDLAARWRPLSDTEEIVASSLLDDAWAVLLTRAIGLSDALDDEYTSVAAVRAVLCSMVLRVLKNPDSLRQEAVDDYSWTRDTAVSAGALYVSAEELRTLGFGRVASGSFTMGSYHVPVTEPVYPL